MFLFVGEWMVQVNREQSQTGGQDKKEEVEAVEEEASEPRGDPEVAPIYVKQLLPVFTHVFSSTMLPSVRCQSSLIGLTWDIPYYNYSFVFYNLMLCFTQEV